MGDIKLADWVREHDLDRKEVDATLKRLAITPTKRGVAYYITGDEAQIVGKKLDLPEELQSVFLWAQWIEDAKNKSWVMAKVDGYEGKRPVKIPRRFCGKMRGKRFEVEKIEDKNGITFRHSWYARLNSYNG